MKKIVAMLVVVLFLFVSCAHRGDWTVNGQPLTLSRKVQLDKARIEAQKNMTVDRLLIEKKLHEKKELSGWGLGPGFTAIALVLIVGVMAWAFVYGFQKSMDKIYFNPGAIFP